MRAVDRPASQATRAPGDARRDRHRFVVGFPICRAPAANPRSRLKTTADFRCPESVPTQHRTSVRAMLSSITSNGCRAGSSLLELSQHVIPKRGIENPARSKLAARAPDNELSDPMRLLRQSAFGFRVSSSRTQSGRRTACGIDPGGRAR
jgi:hypothetical protein